MKAHEPLDTSLLAVETASSTVDRFRLFIRETELEGGSQRWGIFSNDLYRHKKQVEAWLVAANNVQSKSVHSERC